MFREYSPTLNNKAARDISYVALITILICSVFLVSGCKRTTKTGTPDFASAENIILVENARAAQSNINVTAAYDYTLKGNVLSKKTGYLEIRYFLTIKGKKRDIHVRVGEVKANIKYILHVPVYVGEHIENTAPPTFGLNLIEDTSSARAIMRPMMSSIGQVTATFLGLIAIALVFAFSLGAQRLWYSEAVSEYSLWAFFASLESSLYFLFIIGVTLFFQYGSSNVRPFLIVLVSSIVFIGYFFCCELTASFMIRKRLAITKNISRYFVYTNMALPFILMSVFIGMNLYVLIRAVYSGSFNQMRSEMFVVLCILLLLAILRAITLVLSSFLIVRKLATDQYESD